MLNSIRNKILAGNGVLLVVLLLISLFALKEIRGNQRLATTQEAIAQSETEILALQRKLTEYQLAALEYILLFQEDSRSYRDREYSELHELLLETDETDLKARVADVEQLKIQIDQATTAFLDDDKMTGSLRLNEGVAIASEIAATIKAHLAAHKREVKKIADAIQASNTRVSGAIYALLGSMVVIGIGLSLLLASRISQGIRRLQKTVEEIEQHGNLTLRAEADSNDEVGQLAESFNRLVSNLANIVREVTQKAYLLASAAEQLSTITEQTSGGVQRQSDEISQVATAMTQMSATVQEVATNAEQASHSAEEGKREATNGSQVVRETIALINALVEDVQGSAEVIDKLKGDTENIGAVLDVIKNVAEQTNLLALNAAIEAARAGEQGRGFAVVADEVRTLAQRAQASTGEIEALIATLQNGSQQAVEVMKQSRDKAESTVTQARRAGESLEAITRTGDSILSMNTQIASAAEQQSATAVEIDRNLANIQNIAEQTASGAQQTASSSSELSQLSEELRDLVGQFKV